MDDAQLKKILGDIEVPPADVNARKAALNLALAEFDKVQKESSNNLQGTGFWQRLTARTTQNRRRDPMKSKLVYGGMATAMALILVTAVSVEQYNGNIFHQHSAPEVSSSNVTSGKPEQKFNPFTQVKKRADDIQADKNVAAESRAQASQADSSDRWRTLQPAKSELAKEAEAPMDAMAGASIAPPPMAPMPSMTANIAQAPMEAKRAYAPQAEMAIAGGAVMPVPGTAMMYMGDDSASSYYQEQGRDQFKSFEQNPVKVVSAEPVSTFSIDVDTSSYSFVRRMINNGTLPQRDAVRIEELVNYFDYAYPAPDSKETPFKASVAVSDSPWTPGKKLVHIGIKGYDIDKTAAKPHSNLVFLIDTSGSMDAPDKLPLLRNSFKLLLDTLQADDTVGIVVYAGSAGTVLEPTAVKDKAKILAALDNLSAGGSTAGAEGIRQAYQLAETNYKKDAVNRVILATDGDFNVGITDPEELKTYIEHERETGVYLSVLGFGEGNLNDNLMQELAQNGNGSAAYIDTLNEARKVLVQEASSTLFPIAQDVKIQIEFNPATVAEYRLVGYETRALNTEDFNNDKVDAGDIGAGSEVTAIYEITPVGGPVAVDASRYAKPAPAAKVEDASNFSNELAFLKIRYKLPGEKVSKLITAPVTSDLKAEGALAKENEWATAVATFGELLKGGKYSGQASFDDVIRMAADAKGADEFGYRAEFLQLARLAKSMPAMQGLQQPGGGSEVVPVPVPAPMPR